MKQSSKKMNKTIQNELEFIPLKHLSGDFAHEGTKSKKNVHELFEMKNSRSIQKNNFFSLQNYILRWKKE